MAFNHQNLFLIVISACLFSFAIADDSEFYVNEYEYGSEYGQANAQAWYRGNGNRHAYGPPLTSGLGTFYSYFGSGGACGLGDEVRNAPYHAMIAAGNSRIFKQGKGCGECYQVKCTKWPYCSGNPIRVTITDECPGACNDVPFHFDLSQFAFRAMARPGQADNLQNQGQVDIQFRRVQCYYGKTKIAFKTEAACNPNWFATAIESDAGDGGLRSVEIAPAGSRNFVQMTNTWGAIWAANVNPSVHAPFSFRLVSQTGKTVVAWNAVPANFSPGQTYSSNVNFW